MFKSILAALVISTAVITPTFAPAYAEETKMQRTLSLSGHGEVRVVPDIASLSLGVITNAENAAAALDANSRAMKAVLESLKSAGIAAKDIQTSNLMINPRYDDRSSGGSNPQAAGFDATNNVNIVVRDLNSLGKILDTAVAAGANQVNGITFGVENDQPKLDEARKLAVTEARRKAELYATAANVSLGNVISINEGTSYQPSPNAAFKARAESAADVPIANGEQVLAIDVNVTWEIK